MGSKSGTQTEPGPRGRSEGMMENPFKPYYDEDGITIYHGDCIDMLATIEADVMITDPPFGINFSSGQEGIHKGITIANDESTVVRDEALATWGDRPALVFSSWKLPVPHAKQVLVWDKGDASGMGDLSIPWKPNFELICVLGKGFSGPRTSGVIKGHTVVSWASKGRIHPNMKPVSLIRELLAKCPPGTVLDPFMGSGTTLLAAKLEGRRAVGIEINKKYCESAVNRLRQKVLF